MQSQFNDWKENNEKNKNVKAVSAPRCTGIMRYIKQAYVQVSYKLFVDVWFNHRFLSLAYIIQSGNSMRKIVSSRAPLGHLVDLLKYQKVKMGLT